MGMFRSRNVHWWVRKTCMYSGKSPVKITLVDGGTSETEWSDRYLDPVTLIVSHVWSPADCTSTPIYLDGYLYN